MKSKEEKTLSKGIKGIIKDIKENFPKYDLTDYQLLDLALKAKSQYYAYLLTKQNEELLNIVKKQQKTKEV